MPESDQPEPDQPESGKAGKPKRKHSFFVEVLILAAVALVLTFLIQTFVARVFVIPSESMERTLHGCAGCTGDRVLVDKVVYYFNDPKPGDVVVFQRPSTWDQHGGAGRSSNPVVAWIEDIGTQFGMVEPSDEDVVKRVIAVAGQTIECCDDQNRVMVDGKSLNEPYRFMPGPDAQQDVFAKITVPQGMVFVMGDNRNNSRDSRSQGGGGVNGFVPVDNIIGKARAIILPPSRWQGIGDHNPQALSAPAWQTGIPAGLGIAAAWPTLWLGRRVRGMLTAGGRSAPR
ncbi:signal peptidase I [Actinokineospora sp.]|uniref:signal peptidase I n=1 Tax=Actinokineospora sp. TaxID=1872133 RepID=UPI003D6B19F6